MSVDGAESLLNGLARIADADLVRLRAAVDVEMRDRGIAFTIGQMGEELVIDFFKKTPGCPNLTPAATGTANVDALSRKGERYSIKTVCNAKKTGTIYPDQEDKNKQLFEYLLVVKLRLDWTLEAVYEFDWRTFVACRKWDKRMNAWYIGISKKSLELAKQYSV
ncbi:hypothetical protein [Kordiimonas aestuarii]|uniref:hypothetical protein n=1 Tax=Kordiimonas aestuarii TaxID=1005925 RepID=UPI0021D333FE|nr:hypothetical protein [Kordiimonas aestuarii]